ncbi:CubicO group peptidase, beta-lactamase class C family [Trichlorobacter thiogenes]|uniref:CubicO group peptidase, beta-lactamase class C family n=1 Tax=Trichlorobacter thiogenes TaxID=115783 RepID=A0A1T4KEJ7_9BACT|nr:serine hydrolase domain-containing protein [Trichlorobacter thiogenes]SJZ40806.1 CubicO group peptidase, beta-lactamase class C family [Trichlorobacter thiogenes]
MLQIPATVSRYALVIIISVILAGCATAPPVRPTTLVPGEYGYLKEHVAWLIRKEMAKNNVQGLSIALVDDQRVVWAEGFGFADTAAKVPATADTVYRIGSVSKLFTTISALQLVEQGGLALDSPLQQYLPDFSMRSRSGTTAPITLRSIMTHHSGIPSDYLKGMWTTDPQPISTLPTSIRDEYLAFPPNTVLSYSNLGMTLLGLAVQNSSGQEFCRHLQHQLLQPLGMQQTSCSNALPRTAQAARAYSNDIEKQEPPLRDVPAGGLNSSVSDMSRFIRMILAEGALDGRRIIKPETVREMLTPQNSGVALDRGFRIGLGWMLGGLGGINIQQAGTVAHHGGATLYHRAQLVVLPEVKLGVVVLSNTDAAQQSVNTIATEALKLGLEIKTGRTQPDRPQLPTGNYLSSQELQAYQGSYATQAGLGKLEAASDYLKASLIGQSFRLVPRSDTKLQLQYRLLGLFPINLGELGQYGVGRALVDGHELLTVADQNVELVIGEKVKPVPLSVAWQQRLGSYRITNLGNDTPFADEITLRVADGLLLLDYTLLEFGKAKVCQVIRPVSDNEAIVAGLWRGAGETIRVIRENGQEQLVFAGYRLERVK